MSVVLGTRGVTSARGNGSFHCPMCWQARRYEKKSVRRYVILFSAPVIPLGRVAEYVECGGCGSTFDVDALSYDPRTEKRRLEAGFQKAMKRLMVHMLLADGRVDDAELKAVADIYERLSGQSITPMEVGAEAMRLSASDVDPLSIAAQYAPVLNGSGREAVVRAALLVAAADGEVGREEMDLLARIAGALEMTEAHFRGILDSSRAA